MKATKNQIEKGREQAERLKVTILYINNKGEYFTSENLAQLSVKGDKKKYQKLDYSTSASIDTDAEQLEENIQEQELFKQPE